MTDQEKKDKRRGVIGTVMFYLILLPLLYFFGFKLMIPEGEEGVLVSFGNTAVGSGDNQPMQAKIAQAKPEEVKEEPKVTTPPPAPPQENAAEEVAAEDVKTQDFDDEAPVIDAAEKKKEEEAEKKRLEDEAEKKRLEDIESEKKRIEEEQIKKEQEEAEKIRLEEEAEKARKAAEEAERKRIIQEQLDALDKNHEEKQASNTNTANPFASGVGSGSEGKGDEAETGNKGGLNGDPNAKSTSGTGLGESGSSWDVAGRRLAGSLPSPRYTIQEEGVVKVDIVVDKLGKVISASVQPLGTTIQKKELWDAAKAAAMNARFNTSTSAPEKQQGSITYRFVLN